VFDRYYFPTGDGKAVFVDTVPDGLERARHEAEKQVAIKEQVVPGAGREVHGLRWRYRDRVGAPLHHGTGGAMPPCASERDTGRTMSENLDLVRSMYTAFERGDFSSTEWAHPEIEFERIGRDLDEPVRVVGVPEMVASTRDFLSAWEDLRFEVDEYRELDEERVLVLGHYIGRGKRSGVELGQITRRMAAVLHVKDARVRRLVNYWDRDRALADLGLEEEEEALLHRQESTTPDLDELTRRVHVLQEAAKRGDVDTMLSYIGPASVWDDTAVGLGIHDGLASIREHLEDWIGSYEEFEIANEELRDFGNGVAFEVNIQKGRPLGSTGYVQLRYAGVSVFANGKVERFTTYTDIDEARAAAERLAEERR